MRLQSIGLFFITLQKNLISTYVGPYMRCIYLFIDILLGDSLINYDFNSIDVGLFCYIYDVDPIEILHHRCPIFL